MKDAFLMRAVSLARRDGIPPPGSVEIRAHKPLDNDPYITTAIPMVSFRSPSGDPLALLESLWSDDERTHIVDRTAILVNPETGQPHDVGLFFQSRPGCYTAALSQCEISLNRIRLKTAREGLRPGMKMNQHVRAFRQSRDAYCRDLLECFEAAAGMLGVTASQSILKSNRSLFRIPDALHLAGCRRLPQKICG